MATAAARNRGAESPLERFFAIRERGSTVRTEVLGGVVKLLTIAH
jgi:xanthine/uracil/vitamin C permease (AzgA family)